MLLVLALVGCGAEQEEARRLDHWDLVASDGTEIAVVLPSRLDASLPDGPARYTLRTRVEIPEAWRGGPLTLAIPYLEAPVSLRVDGRRLLDLEESLVPRAPSLAAHRFRIEARGAGALELALDVERRWTRGSWVGTVPVLSPTERGDGRFLAVRLVNGPVSLAAYAVLSMIGFVYLALYFLDRRRRVNLWFALQAVGAAYYILERLGLPQVVVGPFLVSAPLLLLSALASVWFVNDYFALARLGGAWRAAPFALLLLGLLAARPFAGVAVVASTLVNFAVTPFQLIRLARTLREGRDPFGARILMLAWILVAVTAAPDTSYFLGFGEPLGGAHTLVLGLATFGVLQAILLGRDHAETLRQSDARVALLEAKDRENTVLNDELRRQIADRSRRLADTLARIGALPSGEQRLAAGDVIEGRYRVVRPLGQGAMGVVVEVERLVDGKRFALKVLTSAKSGAELARLAREAEVAAQASHPNLVGIADVNISDTGALYVVMELVDGSSLAACSDRFGDVPWALGVLEQIANGLRALHALGVIHRDLKPANVLLGRSGVAKIADFGIARIGAGPEAATLPAPDPALAETAGQALTRTGVLMGTPLYMAPELARGARMAGPASDAWSLGVLAFELLTGRLPFDCIPVLEALAGRPLPSPPDLPSTVPGAVATLVRQCLEAHPDRRPTIVELARALER